MSSTCMTQSCQTNCRYQQNSSFCLLWAKFHLGRNNYKETNSKLSVSSYCSARGLFEHQQNLPALTQMDCGISQPSVQHICKAKSSLTQHLFQLKKKREKTQAKPQLKIKAKNLLLTVSLVELLQFSSACLLKEKKNTTAKYKRQANETSSTI